MKRAILIIVIIIVGYNVAVTQSVQDSVINKIGSLMEHPLNIKDTLVNTDSIQIFTLEESKKERIRRIKERIIESFNDFDAYYEMTTAYPNQDILKINGHLAIHGNNHYDSSNVHFLLKNDDWFISADHNDKHLIILDQNDERQRALSLSAQSNNGIQNIWGSDSVQVTIEEEDKQRITLKYVSSKMSTNNQAMIVFDKINDKIISAFVTAKIPIESDDTGWDYVYADEIKSEEDYITMELKYKKISSPSNLNVFDEKKTIRTKGKKIGLISFKDYRVLNRI